MLLISIVAHWILQPPTDDPVDPLSANDSSIAAPVHEPPARTRVKIEVVENTLPEENAAPVVVDATPVLRGSVKTEAGDPVADVVVLLFGTAAQPLATVRSGSDGQFRFEFPPDGATEVVVRQSGHVTVVERLGPSATASDSAPLALTLRPEEVIEGRVRLIHGGVPRTPVRVLARPVTSGYPTFVHARSARDGDARFASVETDASGCFRIEGLEPGVSYALVVGGPGLVLAMDHGVRAFPARAGDRGIELEVAPIFLLDVRVREHGGTPLRVSTELRGPGAQTRWTMDRRAIATLPPASPELQWAEVPGIDRAATTRRHGAYMILAGAADADRMGPFSVHATAPGYEPAGAEVYAHRLGRGPIEPDVLELKPLAEDFGRLIVKSDADQRLAKALSGTAGASLHGTPSLILYPMSGGAKGSREFGVRAFDASGGDVEIDGLPVGGYRAVFDVWFGDASTQRVYEFAVSADRPAVVEVEIPRWSVVEVDPVTVDGKPIEGPIVVTLLKPENSQIRMWPFKKRPYLITGVEPRAFELKVTKPGMVPARTEIELQDATVTRVEMTLDVAPKKQ